MPEDKGDREIAELRERLEVDEFKRVDCTPSVSTSTFIAYVTAY